MSALNRRRLPKPLASATSVHRQRRIGQQALREQQPLRLRIFDRRNAELRVEDAPQVPARHADARGQHVDAALLEYAIFDQLDSGLREARRRVDARKPGRQLGPAAQAGSKAFDFRRGRAAKEAAVLAARQADGADGPTIDAVSSERRRRSGRRSGRHARRARGSSCRNRASCDELCALGVRDSPFSDMCAGPASAGARRLRREPSPLPSIVSGSHRVAKCRSRHPRSRP